MIEKLKAYEIISKAFDENRVSTEIFLKAQGGFLNLLKSIKPLESISFGDENSLSAGELMEVLADNSKFQHYCDAIILNDGKILLVQRSNNDNFAPGKWCLPGGKAEQGELLREAVVRELLEETGICADGCHYSTLYRNEDGSFSHYFFCNCCDFENKVVDADEVQQVAWVGLDELDQYDTLLDVGKRIKEIFNVPFKGKVLTEQELAAIAANKPVPIKKANTATSLSTSYKKGCLMLDVKFDDGVSEWAWDSSVIDKVSWEDVYDLPGYGKETQPHVTVLYGFELPTVTPDHIERLLPEGSVVFKISDVSVFEQEEYDVLKFGIESEQLHQLNSLYKGLPNSNSYPDYKPHLTIAYLKKGRADKYIELFSRFIGKQFQSSKFDYSYNNADGLKVKAQWDTKGYESIEDDPADKILKGKKANIGEIREWGGKKWQKQANGEWKPIEEKSNKIDLTESEKEALEYYTEFGHQRINDELRAPVGDKELENQANLISLALKKFSTYKGIVTRFQPLPENIYDHLKNNVGKEIKFRAFTSTSKIENLNKKRKDDFIFKIKSHSGKDISKFSSREEEQEVLFDKGTHFKILSVEGNVIHFEEVLDSIQKANKPDSIQKSFDQGEISTAEYFEYLEKAKQYQIGQVSETTGLKKIAPGKWVDPATGKAVKTDDERNIKKKPDISTMSDEQLQEYAKNSSESELQETIKNSRDPKLREIAHNELQRREQEEKPNEDNELSDEEIKAINDYTQTEYRKLNRQLRSGKVDVDVMKKIEFLSNSLKKLPDHKGTVHRGFSPIKELEEHLADFENNIGGEIEFPAFTSTSQSLKVIEDFGTVMSFEMVSKTGKDISHLSDFEEEQEILFDRGTKFKVKKVKKKVAKGKLMNFKVFLEEV